MNPRALGLVFVLLAASALVGCANRNNYGCPGGACRAPGSAGYGPAPVYGPAAPGEIFYEGSSPGTVAPAYPATAPGSGSR